MKKIGGLQGDIDDLKSQNKESVQTIVEYEAEFADKNTKIEELSAQIQVMGQEALQMEEENN